MAQAQNHAGSVSSIYSATLLRGLSEFGAATATAVARCALRNDANVYVV